MDFFTTDAPGFGEPYPYFPMSSPDLLQPRLALYGGDMDLDLASQSLPADGHLPTEQRNNSNTAYPSPALHIYATHETESLGHVETMPAVPMGPPTKTRKRKAPTLRADEWEPYKARILELHIEQKLPLREVKEQILSEFGFTAEVRQYRTRISQWGRDKNIKPDEMKAIVRKRQRRILVEDKGDLRFTVRGNTVEPEKIDRWMKRNEVLESFLYAPSPAASTPSAVGCRTISEIGSPAPSPAYSARSPHFLPANLTDAAQSPTISSPALSISSMDWRQASTLQGQGPAPTYQTPSSFTPGVISTPIALQSKLNPATDSVQRRYQGANERRLRDDLSRAETIFGVSHPKTLDILEDLASVLLEQGRYKSAEKLAHKAVQGRQRIGGNRNAKTLDALELIGNVFKLQGRYAEAETLFGKIIEAETERARIYAEIHAAKQKIDPERARKEEEVERARREAETEHARHEAAESRRATEAEVVKEEPELNPDE
ncbi:hypothetical protein K505DRAFT_374918 [Melanomma pulvis-pyrius CBS 109.77]|uniref:Clr5 domain-containing protein n=1 Tax=Melanomma pulvis-pyrius CBS 109.77 TaxID=1314802 RepID=A0A6A6XE82_9PLEO|nr:hypothetical protein K505DRAFT_374918 [Melanomma pulvis-pyrius CBS 109.77]